jgi:acyl carrier protein
MPTLNPAEWLLRNLQEILFTDTVSLDENLANADGGSLSAMILAARIEDTYGVSIALDVFFDEFSSFRDIVVLIETHLSPGGVE